LQRADEEIKTLSKDAEQLSARLISAGIAMWTLF
jgi:hypothetical protein